VRTSKLPINMQFNSQSRRSFLKKTGLGLSGIVAASAFPAIVPASVFGKNAPSNRISIGQIGFGRIARSHDLPDILKNDIAHVMAVAEVDRKRKEMGKEWIEQQYA